MILPGAALKAFAAVALGTATVTGVGVFAEEGPELPPQAEAGIEIAETAAGGGGDDSNEDDLNEEELNEDPEVLGQEDDNGAGTGHETCFAATEHARGVLQGLLDGSFFEELDLPEDADAGLDAEGQEGVAQSLEAINNCGMGDDGDVEASEGPPEGTPQGPPEGVPIGPPEGTPEGAPEDTPNGPPEGVPSGPPEGVPGGPPEGVPGGPS